MLLEIIAPLVVKLEHCNAMEFIQSDALGKIEVCGVMTVLNNAGLLFLFLLVNLAKVLEESGVDAFMDSVVGTTNGFFLDLDNMVVSECSL
eukprot:3598490-Ditylum_brightwellii.AAC.1